MTSWFLFWTHLNSRRVLRLSDHTFMGPRLQGTDKDEDSSLTFPVVSTPLLPSLS